MEKDIETLRNMYYNSILDLTDRDDIITALPRPEYSNFYPVINGLIKKLAEEEEKKKEELKKALTEKIKVEHQDEIKLIQDEIELIQYEIELIQLKKNICIELLKEAERDEKIEENARGKRKKIVFSKTSSGNIYLLKDLKDIPQEYYGAILESLKKIEEGYQEENTEKAKLFTSSNKKLSGIHEIKPFKIRIAYKFLDQDTAYILIARVKKDNNSSLDREEIIDRAEKTDKEFNRLKSAMKNPAKKEALLETSEQEKDEIYEYLIKNKRGRGYE